MCYWCLCQRSDEWMCLWLFLNPWFCSIDPRVCFCASITLDFYLFWLDFFFKITVALKHNLKSGVCSHFPELPLLFWVFFCFQMNFGILFSSSVRNAIRILIEFVLNLYICFGSMIILTILVFPTQEQRTTFQFLKSFLISFLRVLWFSLERSFTSFVRCKSQVFNFSCSYCAWYFIPFFSGLIFGV